MYSESQHVQYTNCFILFYTPNHLQTGQTSHTNSLSDRAYKADNPKKHYEVVYFNCPLYINIHLMHSLLHRCTMHSTLNSNLLCTNAVNNTHTYPYSLFAAFYRAFRTQCSARSEIYPVTNLSVTSHCPLHLGACRTLRRGER